ncbi:uncharacterized protein LOC124256894 [Haliotis rubra]|uniref:uncharacterized protein LOC124256894 n=1 Tax=Haliotis rubra TaxID=36100 RepID=UPI001EE57120|nr:uncharacterized protein LOC124256894 [Haliotis rubra]
MICFPDSDDSDDDPWNSLQSVQQRQLLGRHYRPGAEPDQIFTVQVYDIRNTSQIVPAKYESFPVDRSSCCSTSRTQAIADRYGVPLGSVYTDRKEKEAVIYNDLDLHVVFIDVRSQNYRAPSSNYTEQGCVGIDPKMSVAFLKELICQSENFQIGENVGLFYRKIRLDDEAAIGACVKFGDHLLCVDEVKLQVSCFHRPRRKIENQYRLDCLNTLNVREMKNRFRDTFQEDFPGLQNGAEDIWFTQGKNVLKDEDFLFITTSLRQGLNDRGRMMVHVKPPTCFPVVIKFLGSNSKEAVYHVLIVPPNITSSQFRSEASVLVEHPPNALRLLMNNKKLRKPAMIEENGFVPNCAVSVRVAEKIVVNICVNMGMSSLQNVQVNLYKLDTVSDLKRLVSRQTHVDPADLQMFFEDKEVINDRQLMDYRIRDGDTLFAVHFKDSIHLMIRQPGMPPSCLTVEKFRQCKVKKVKMFLAQVLQTNRENVNIIHRGKCLIEDISLADAGLCSGDTLLIPRVIKDDYRVEGMKRVFVSTCDGTVRVTMAVLKGGITFYAPESIPLPDIEELSTLRCNRNWSQGLMLGSIELSRSSPRESSSSIQSLQQSFRTFVEASTESESSLTESLRCKQNHSSPDTSTRILNRPSLKLILPGQHSEPDSRVKKRFTLCKELAQEGDKVMFRESSLYEEDVSQGGSQKRFPSSEQMVDPTSPDVSDTASPKVFRSPSLLFPPQAIQNSILEGVSLELGHSWKRVALILGLTHSDLENLEYRHHGNLHEQALQALMLWKKRESKKATITKLKEALKECGLTLVADAINENIKYETT